MNSFNFIVSSTSTCGEKSVIKLQKPLDKVTKVIGLKIKAPRSMIFGNIKVLGEVDSKYTLNYLLKIR
ncbi:hypothetical protein [Spiroplasma ixodetis]|uniref:hypothetical protein n=1 Tax=Spiroplasma ixodetis TaxID=2141 RepID=UPI002578794E|nr:hypothetical protein [Spiroplasma ixodetis]